MNSSKIQLRSYLWSDSYRRNEYKFTSAHENMMRKMKSYLLTYIVNDAIEEHFIVWSKRKKSWFSFTMQTAWCEMRDRLRRTQNVANNDVTSKSHSHEIKKINRKSWFFVWSIDVTQLYDEISDWRSRFMKTIKNLVKSLFFSNQCLNINKMKERCIHFLKNDRFTCLQICSIKEINLFQCSTNFVDVQWTFVDNFRRCLMNLHRNLMNLHQRSMNICLC